MATRTQVTDVENLAIADIANSKQFQDKFVWMFSGDEERKKQWLELGIIAPTVFGTECFDKSKTYGETGDKWSEDYRTLVETLEQGLYMTRHGVPMPELPRLKKGEVATAHRKEIAAKIASVRGGVSQYHSRMKAYYAASMDVPKDAKELPSLSKWAKAAYLTVAGRPEGKTKAIAPKVIGVPPMELLEILAILTIEDATQAREALAAYREAVAKVHAGTVAAQQIARIQNKPRVAVKSDAPKAKRTIKV